jgi:asparagine synthase (glutamine-hydrolysing)
MCGIIGLIQKAEAIKQLDFNQARDTLSHRGPNACGSEFFEGGRIALGHRRLSFLDLSSLGNQPMANEDERIWIVFNGEIYNFEELRTELRSAGHRFTSRSDTEVIIHGYEEWGEAVLDRLNGMFAFGLVDLNRKQLFLARDRFGIKPLYFTLQGNTFAFASELKALVACPNLNHTLDIGSVADFLNYRYVPSPKTIWSEIAKLPPAHALKLDYSNWNTEIKQYWQLPFGNRRISSEDLVDRLNKRLSESVRIHALADVPVGSFLSGGYDSSALVYYLVKAGHKPQTFAIGFKDWEDSEHHHAGCLAESLGVPLLSEIVDEESLDSLSTMPDVYDEPIADISILPTWMVSRLAAKHVKAVTGGEGADEIFGGYWWQQEIYQQQPHSRREWLWRRIRGKSVNVIDFYANAMGMGRFDRGEMEKTFCSHYHHLLPEDPDWFYRDHFDPTLSPFKAVQKLDIKCFMGELVLTKVDRASMAHSLEVRVPFLDHELYSDLLSLHEDCVIKAGVTKFPLQQILRGNVPEQILLRKKQGFVGPEEHYQMFNFYRQGLANSRLISDGIIREDYLESRFAERDAWRLWKLLILEQWYQRWI